MIEIIINQKLIRCNHSERCDRIKYIVIHDTGNSNRTANANNHYLYFNSGYRAASAHYFVDDTEIVQTVRDCRKSWHCGDGRGRYGITNDNSIGIELCVNEGSDRNKAKSKLKELTEHLMKKHGISKERVVRHYDASRKTCPASMSANNWKEWQDFKNSLKEE